MDLYSSTQTEFNHQVFQGVICQNEMVSVKVFHECVFKDCSFLETVFSDCKFVECSFEGCDLRLMKVKDCSFRDTVFKDSQAIGVNWTEAHWGKEGILNSIRFTKSALSHSIFMGLKLHKIVLAGCVAKNVDFAEADLTHADCTDTDFSNSRFLHTNLTEADFTGASNYSIDARLNVLKETKFSLPEAMSLLYSLDIILTE